MDVAVCAAVFSLFCCAVGFGSIWGCVEIACWNLWFPVRASDLSGQAICCTAVAYAYCALRVVSLLVFSFLERDG
jgi:hypothetical protein